MDKRDWEWFGNAGHFILGDECKFHLTTILNKRILVSTVGELPINTPGLPEFDTLGGEDGNFYETMVFDEGEWEYCEDGCGTPLARPNSGDCLNMDRYKTRKDANVGHLLLCEKWEEK